MRQINDQQYAQFTPKERVQLVFAALARNDEAEATRLWETCPRHTFTTTDLNFTEQVSALNLIGAMFFEKCVCHYNCIKKVEHFISEVEMDLKFEERENLLEPANQSQKTLELAETAKKGHLSCLKALFKGFEQFCAEAGVNSKDILKTIPIEDSCWDINYLLETEGDLEEQLIKNFHDMFLSCWNF